jgi:hypothetical protein
MNAIFTGFIIGCGDDTPFRWITGAANDNRLPYKNRIPFLFDSGKEGVHVYVEDAPSPFIGIAHIRFPMPAHAAFIKMHHIELSFCLQWRLFTTPQ